MYVMVSHITFAWWWWTWGLNNLALLHCVLGLGTCPQTSLCEFERSG